MQIKDMFTKPIDRDLHGVVIVGQDDQESIKQELEEYVVTDELQEHFANIFSAYRKGIGGHTPKMGIWISGFFGSGKSHLLKILAYLLKNKKVFGKKPIDYFKDDHKIKSQRVIADMEEAAATPTDTILFNIDSKSETGNDRSALVLVFLKVFNEMQGFCGAIPVVADLERNLSNSGQYAAFKQKFQEINGSTWEESRNDFDFIQDEVVEALVKIGYMSEQNAWNICTTADEPYSISNEDFAHRVKQYIDQKGNDHHVVFLIDEVGQYIGDNSELMLNLQTLTEELGRQCGGKAWIVVTAQQDIDSVTKVKGADNFSKIQGRFDTRISLSSANADEVIKKRVLEKNKAADQTLQLMYQNPETVTMIKNNIFFDDTVERKLYANAKDFSEVYPFIPYQFNLLASVLTAIRTHGASGKHISEGERSMLAMFKEAAMAYMHCETGTLIPFSAFFEPMKNFLDHSHRSVIIKAYDNNIINPEHDNKANFTIEVLKTLFMVKYVADFNATANNITALLISSIDEQRDVLHEKVMDALNILLSQKLIQKNGDVYVFLTNEEQEINQAIMNENVGTSEVLHKVSELIFEGIFPSKRYVYPEHNGRYVFNFNQAVDDNPYNSHKQYDIGVRVLTPAYDVQDENTLRMMSGQKNEVIVVLPNDRAFMDEIQTAMKIEQFLIHNASSSAIASFDSLKDTKSREYSERNANAKLYLTEALKEAQIYVNGDLVNIKSKEPVARINEALERLVDKVYFKLSYIDVPMNEEDIIKLLKSDSQITLDVPSSKSANSAALEDLKAYIKMNTQAHMLTSIKTIKDKFMKAPYGFVEDDVDWLVAKLFSQTEITFEINSEKINTVNRKAEELYNYISKKQYAEKLMISTRTRIPDNQKKICRDLMSEVFHQPSAETNEDELQRQFNQNANGLYTYLQRLEGAYADHPYPGRNVITNGKKLMRKALNLYSTEDFFEYMQQSEDDFLDFSEDFAPLDDFFKTTKNNQKAIFDESLKNITAYEKSADYIEDGKLNDIVENMHAILNNPNPYREIQKLPEFNGQFDQIYGQEVEVAKEEMFGIIDQSCEQVMTALESRTYKNARKADYMERFNSLEDDLKKCNDLSDVKGFKSRAATIVSRIFKEMDALDLQAAKREEEKAKKRQAESKQDGSTSTPVSPAPKVKKTKTVLIQDVIEVPSWHIESETDIERYVSDLEAKLKQAIKDDTTVNIVF